MKRKKLSILFLLILIFTIFPFRSSAQELNEGFTNQTFPPNGWTHADSLWFRSNVSGFCSGTGSAFANFYAISSGSYALTSPVFNASAINDSLIFQDAYASFSGENDQLQIMYSVNGGVTFSQLVLLNGGTSGELVTAPPTTMSFIPTCSQWRYQRRALPVGTNRLRFVGISAYGNELYIDSIRVVRNLVGIENNHNSIPAEYSISQNYPNPFNPSTKIDFSLPKASFTKLVIFDVSGKEAAELVNRQLQAGKYSVTWNALLFSSGVYFYHLTAGEYSETKSMVLIK